MPKLISGGKRFMPIFALALSALFSTIPLLFYQDFTFGQDIAYHINWSSQVSTAIKEGVLYPRWMALSNEGYGSPTMIFYAPLFYWITGIVNLFVSSLILSMKLTTLAGFFLSGLTMYVFLKNFCNHAGSVTGGIAYQLLPYHIFDLYVQGTMAELFAFVWLPLIFHFAYKGFTEDALRDWIALAFSYAGLILTHIVSSYIFTFVLAGFGLFLSVKMRSLRVLGRFTAAGLFGFCLSAVYFMPMFFERSFVHIEWLTEAPFADYRHNFLFSAENVGKLFYKHLNLVAVLQLILLIISLMVVYKKKKGDNQTNLPFFLWLSAASLFISSPFSMPVWNLMPGLKTIQFPWRWLMVSTFATSIMIGLTADIFSFFDIKKDRFLRFSAVLFCGFVFYNLYLVSFYLLKAEPVPKKDTEWILHGGGDVIEYLPVWLIDKKNNFPKGKEGPVTFKEGVGMLDIVHWRAHSRLFRVSAELPATVRVSTFYYPGWTALIDGREIPVGIEKDSGAMLINVPPGKNEVLLEFRDTPLRRVAKWISIISLLAALFGLAMAKRKSY